MSTADPVFDSESMISLALGARTADLDVRSVELRDVSGLPLDAEFRDPAVETIRDALQASDRDLALDALDGPGGPYIIVDFEVEHDSGDRGLLTYEGYVADLSGPAAADVLRSVLAARA